MFLGRGKFFERNFSEARRGNIRDVLIIALPMLLSMSFDTLMTFADRLFLSKLSPELMNAALAGGSAQIVVMTFFNGVISYATAQVAQNYGARQFLNCSRAAFQAMLIALVSSPLVLLLSPFVYWMFETSGVKGEQLSAQILYFDTLLYGAIFVLFRQVFSSFFSGIGRTRIIMIAAFIGMLVNIFFNYFLIFGVGPFPKLGILGAAYGTILGNAATVLILVGKFFGKACREKFGLFFSFHRKLFLELLRRGSASGAEMFLCMLAFQTLILLFHGMDSRSATAATIMFNWDMVAYVPLLGLEVASTSLSGRYIGARDSAAVRRAVRSAMIVGVGFSIVVAILFIGIPHILVDMFSPQGEDALFLSARPHAISMLRIASLYVLVETGLVVFAGALRGAGDTFWVMVSMVLLNWLTVLILWIFRSFFHFGVVGCWISVVIAFSLFPLALLFRWKSGKWRHLITPETIEC